MVTEVLPELSHGALPSERRKWGRFVADVGELVVHVASDDCRPAELLDESFGGIGLLLCDGTRLFVDRQVEVSYDGIAIGGVVRAIEPFDGDRYRVSIEWEPIGTHVTCHTKGGEKIEGRLFMLFRMWESANWDELAATAAKLAKEAENLGVKELVRPANTLNEVIESSAPKADICKALDALVDAFTFASADEL
jgi:hypothetical protein